ncbi:uncharacterized protein LAESUDRAFT_721819 [Laetiporus sulphureus 93-53]|uniref:Uncharacterized protein n=1 Tax=Laetiporus sulphureus 93-53 TaxID=1314785 RepID=A0A165GK02_9APHY|nr:uncharacterized protein LAESUDRAFT_721819 [Laetiporus sulphureus 93-53]KZT10457.1 hypothetical protein LAESUDRAFT_721819 [Laetiporus sulphureus 93-53]
MLAIGSSITEALKTTVQNVRELVGPRKNQKVNMSRFAGSDGGRRATSMETVYSGRKGSIDMSRLRNTGWMLPAPRG